MRVGVIITKNEGSIYTDDVGNVDNSRIRSRIIMPGGFIAPLFPA